MPQIHKFFSLFLSLCTGQEEENGVLYEFFYEESCGDAQDLSSPDEEDEPLLSNSRSFIGNFSILRLLFEIASLKVCAQVRIGFKKIHTNSKITEHSFFLYVMIGLNSGELLVIHLNLWWGSEYMHGSYQFFKKKYRHKQHKIT